MYNQRTVTLVPLTPSQIYEDQVRLQKESEQKKKSEKESEQKKKSEKVSEQKKKSEKESEQKKNCEKESEQKKKCEKESEQKKESDKKQVTENLRENERKANFYAVSEVKRALFLNKPTIVLLYKEALFNTNQLDTSLPSYIISLLQEFEDVFPAEIPKGLPPIRGIEHQIDFIPGATIPNRPTYRSNPEETKEL